MPNSISFQTNPTDAYQCQHISKKNTVVIKQNHFITQIILIIICSCLTPFTLITSFSLTTIPLCGMLTRQIRFITQIIYAVDTSNMLVLVLQKRNTCIPCISANLQPHRASCNNYHDTLFSYILVFNFLPVAISNYVATLTTLVEVFNTCGFDASAVRTNNLYHNISNALMIAASSASNRVGKPEMISV
jgi:hypothetical protein